MAVATPVPEKTLLLVGTSHRRAGLELRERLALGPGSATELARRLAAGGLEAAVLSTCNRTEVYLAHVEAEAALASALAELAGLSGLSASELEPNLDVRENREAALHLFRVAAGLDSLVLGEGQILGQVRSAYDAALAAGATGPILNRLFAHALHSGKRVRSELALSEVPESVPAAAAELARRLLGDLERKRILLIGAGKAGALAAASFLSRGADKVFVANHRMERAEALARRFGGEAVPFARLGDEVVHADVVVSSTRCPRTILAAADVAPAVRRRRGRPILFLDIAVPRDLDPAIGALEGARLYDIDALGVVPDGGSADERNAEELARAEAAVAAEADAFCDWRASLGVVPAIASLRRRAEEIRAAELARSASRFRDLSPSERAAVETVTSQIVNKLLHAPTVRMKEAAATPDGPTYAEALSRLFALEETG